MKKEQWVKAIGIYHELLLEDPKNAHLLFVLGMANFRLDHNAQAMTFLEKSLERDSNNADAHLFLGFLYERDKRLDDAEGEFKATLNLVPEYEDAKKALERIEKARLPDVPKEPEFSVWQEMMIERAEKVEKKKYYIEASRDWYELYNDDSTNPLFTYRLGQVLGWMSRPNEAIYFLNKTLDLKPEHTDAMLRLGYQEMALGHYKVAEQFFNEVLSIDGERTDALDGLTRSLYLQARYCAAKNSGLRRFAQGNPDYFIYKLFHQVINHTNMSTKGGLLYVQERETDILTKIVTAQRNTFVSEVSGKLPLTECLMLKGSFLAGTTREINLVNGTNNLFVPGNITRGALDWQAHPRVALSAGCSVEHGRDTGDPNFKLGHRTRLQPAGSIAYNGVNQAYTFVGYADSLLVKLFGTERATLLPRTTYSIDGQLQLFQNRIKFNTTHFLCYYFGNEPNHNRQWDCQLWAESGYPRFGSVLFLRYIGRVGGFRSNQNDYYSYKRQWEHGMTLLFSRDTVLNTEIEFAYHHAWQWSRDLNQPVNTIVFVQKLFRGIDVVYLELRQLYRPNIRGIFHSEYYFDTTNYKTWSVKGSLNLIF